MKIAPGIDAADWKRLKLDEPCSPDWEIGISLLKHRLRGRFTDVVDLLIEQDEKREPQQRKFGFTILAIDCLLLETLEAFRQGLTDTRSKSAALCINFLSQRPAFKNFFDVRLAKRFYYEFRCGVLHNAQVFGTGLVWSVGPLLVFDDGRMIINRTAFHEALKLELEMYLNELRDPSMGDLRNSFRRKMDFVADGLFQP